MNSALNRLRRSGTAAYFALGLSLAGARANQVVINEVMYHPPADLETLQYIELFNAGSDECDLSGWSFSKGVKFKFAKGTKLAPNAYLVVCRDRVAFTKQYGQDVPLAGAFDGHLSHNGEKLELADAEEKVIDAVKYDDSKKWPAAADGNSSSLERICPTASGDDPANWAASNLPEIEAPAGTPGKVNDSFSANPLPVVTDIELTPKAPKPEKETTVAATVSDADEVKSVELIVQFVSPREVSEPISMPMTRVSGDGKTGNYQATIPAQPEGRVVRYRVQATDTTGAKRSSPMPNDLRQAWSYSTYVNNNTSKVPFGLLIVPPQDEQGQPRRVRRYSGYGQEPEPKKTRGIDTFIYMPAGGGEVQTFDFVQVPRRKGGHKVRFLKGQALRGMSTINLIFESSPRYILTEPLSYEVYRLAGVPSELSEHIRVSLNGEWLGYHLLVEQPNKSFLSRNKRNTDGNLYKLLWYGNGIEGMHEKKTNLTGNHDDLHEAITGLAKRDPKAQWAFIEKNINVDEFVNYYAVNMCILNWDGFFNNYFLYHDTGDTGLWEIYPWDEDKTFGDYDGASSRYDWIDMPLTYGMTGDQRPASLGGPSAPRFSGWWRAPGYFSGPLLANPQFRERFLKRLREICTTIYTKEKIHPFIDAMEQRLENEVVLRAQSSGQDPKGAVARFRSDIRSLRDQVTRRQKFVLDELNKLKK